MSHFLGEFDCKLDAKGRLMVPSNLKKQLPNVETEGLVINRGFEKHLVIWRHFKVYGSCLKMDQWSIVIIGVNVVNRFRLQLMRMGVYGPNHITFGNFFTTFYS